METASRNSVIAQFHLLGATTYKNKSTAVALVQDNSRCDTGYARGQSNEPQAKVPSTQKSSVDNISHFHARCHQGPLSTNALQALPASIIESSSPTPISFSFQLPEAARENLHFSMLETMPYYSADKHLNDGEEMDWVREHANPNYINYDETFPERGSISSHDIFKRANMNYAFGDTLVCKIKTHHGRHRRFFFFSF